MSRKKKKCYVSRKADTSYQRNVSWEMELSLRDKDLTVQLNSKSPPSLVDSTINELEAIAKEEDIAWTMKLKNCDTGEIWNKYIPASENINKKTLKQDIARWYNAVKKEVSILSGLHLIPPDEPWF